MQKSTTLCSLVCALLIAPAAQAWNCDHERQLDQVLDLSGSEEVVVSALAGDLEIRSGAGSEALIRGKVCVSEEKWLEEAVVRTEGGKRAEITVELPETSGWSITGNHYAYIDLELVLPDDIAVTVADSSGDAEISGLASLSIKDSSGDLDISDINGPVVLKDSSGSIELEDIRGDVTVDGDSSGDIDGELITGSVVVEQDSSGSIHFTDVGGDVLVKRDSSGDITAENVGGDFTVLRDGSGSIRAINVDGKVDIPKKS